MAPLELNALHIGVLVLGQQFGLKLVDTRLARNALGRALRIAREHNDMLDAQRMQVGDGLTDAGLERILDTEHADDLAINRQIQRRQALHLGLDLLLDVGLELRTLILKYKVRGTDDGATPLNGRGNAVRHDVLDRGMAFAVLEPALAGGVDHGTRHRMREMLLQACGKAQNLVLTPAIGREHASQARLRLGERAGLIKHNGVGLGKRLKVLRALDHHAHLGGIAHGGHDGDGTRELECTRVVDHQRRRSLDEATCGESDKAREQEVTRDDLVGEVLHMRLTLGLERVGRLHERDDRAELSLSRVGAHAHQDAAIFHDGSGEHVVACAAHNGKRLAGQGRLVDHGASLLDHAVNADGHAGAHGYQVAGLKLGGGNAHLGVTDHFLRLVGHIEQRVDELVFAHGAGVVLEQLAHVEQKHCLARGVDITLDERNADGRSVEHGNGQARLRELTEGGAQKGHVTGHDKHCAQRRGQKPSACIVSADKCGKIHDELVPAWLKLHHVTRLCVGNSLDVECAQGIEHTCTTLLVVLQRHLANAAIYAHLVHAVDFAAKLKKCIEIALWHRTRQLKTGPAGDLANNRESHSLCLGALLGCLVSSGLALGDVGSLGNHIVDLGLGLLDHVLVAILDAHAARDTLHAGILYRSAGEQLDASRTEQKTATDKQGVKRRLLHVVSPFCRIGCGVVP